MFRWKASEPSLPKREGRPWIAALWVLLLAASGCSRQGPVHSFIEEPFPKNLSAWNFFSGHPPAMRPNKGVLAYDLNTPLFSDYASKYRFVWMPPGTSAEYKEDGVFDFPLGAVLIKSFAFPDAAGRGAGEEKLIETRLLVHTQGGWVGLPYVWNENQSEAHLELVPDPVPISYRDAGGKQHDFTYFIPNANECKLCHEKARVMLPIGPKARNLNKDFAYPDAVRNQLVRWTEVGYLRGAPSPQAAPRVAQWDLPASGSLEQRARAYLDNNCAHCHQSGGTAGYTGFDLRLAARSAELGVCKSPNSAGRVGTLTYDLVPGKPEESILVARMESTRPKEMMPQIGRSVVHEEGLALVREWVRSMHTDGAACASGP
jgi:uncharacterized repeat protein (TIGR03806 family)